MVSLMPAIGTHLAPLAFPLLPIRAADPFLTSISVSEVMMIAARLLLAMLILGGLAGCPAMSRGTNVTQDQWEPPVSETAKSK